MPLSDSPHSIMLQLMDRDHQGLWLKQPAAERWTSGGHLRLPLPQQRMRGTCADNDCMNDACINRPQPSVRANQKKSKLPESGKLVRRGTTPRLTTRPAHQGKHPRQMRESNPAWPTKPQTHLSTPLAVPTATSSSSSRVSKMELLYSATEGRTPRPACAQALNPPCRHSDRALKYSTIADAHPVASLRPGSEVHQQAQDQGAEMQDRC